MLTLPKVGQKSFDPPKPLNCGDEHPGLFFVNHPTAAEVSQKSGQPFAQTGVTGPNSEPYLDPCGQSAPLPTANPSRRQPFAGYNRTMFHCLELLAARDIATAHPGDPAAAGLIQGQAGEAQPAAIMRGLTWTAPDAAVNELVRPPEEDLFR